LRGGSWNNNQDNARCAYRNNNNPHNRNNNVGFRVAESFFLKIVCVECEPEMPGGVERDAAQPRLHGRKTGSILTAPPLNLPRFWQGMARWGSVK
jgi:hypothetical protein